jgi:hypothetical protein
MFRIIRTRTLTALQEAGRELVARRQAQKTHDTTVGELAALWARHHMLRGDYENLLKTHSTVREQARDWEARCNSVINGIGAWVNEVRAAMAHPTDGHKYQGELAIALWRSFVARAEEAGDGDQTAVWLIKNLILTPMPEEGAISEEASPSDVPTSHHGLDEHGYCWTCNLPRWQLSPDHPLSAGDGPERAS